MEESDNLTMRMSGAAERLDGLQSLMEEIHEIQRENRRNDETLDRVEEIIEESSRIVENSEVPHEMIIDATILHTGTQIVHSTIAAFNTNLTAFNDDEYEINLLSCLEEMGDDTRIISSPWEAFFDKTFHLFKKTEPITYVLGTFNLEPPPKKEKKKAERLKKGPEAQKKVLSSSENKENEKEEESDVYGHILKCLVRCYKNNGRKPIGYFHFVIDPSDYWQTVENIFHFSFLVRDNNVKMMLDENKLPIIEPIQKKKGNADEQPKENGSEKTSGKKNQQFCFRLSVGEWKDCINSFNIRSANITPFEKRNNVRNERNN